MAVGVLALQGSFNEHIAALRRIGVKGVEIRKAEQLENVSSLIIPGGESTTMAKLAELHNLKTGGQELVGGLDCTVHRNFFGSQIQSFEAELPVPDLAATEGGPPSFRAVFIRAPAILEVGPDVEVLASISIQTTKKVDPSSSLQSQEESGECDVAASSSSVYEDEERYLYNKQPKIDLPVYE
ncbi:Glutamine amidotransferase subunit PdxT [Cynara cardunculus var. scolymus]|uniref:glutaminase n=1 Tax=Cynara cardunculus var. scolymus TaxID=59895 RepID=A0A103Y0C9_CYNCS|nr:Glutamine amidotransferase subunit PdxT [Cynara cardunculus var. scolymus]